MTMKVKAKMTSNNKVHVKMLIKHPMETGQRKDSKTGKPIPAHFVEAVTCHWQDKELLRAHWGPAISKNPYLSFKLSGPKAGDVLMIRWSDNQGKSGELASTIG